MNVRIEQEVCCKKREREWDLKRAETRETGKSNNSFQFSNFTVIIC